MKRYLDAMVRRNKLDSEARDLAAETAPEFYKPDIELGEPVLKPKEPVFEISPFMLDGAAPQGTPARGLNTPQPGVKKPLPTPNQKPPPKKKKRGWLFGR